MPLFINDKMSEACTSYKSRFRDLHASQCTGISSPQAGFVAKKN